MEDTAEKRIDIALLYAGILSLLYAQSILTGWALPLIVYVFVALIGLMTVLTASHYIIIVYFYRSFFRRCVAGGFLVAASLFFVRFLGHTFDTRFWQWVAPTGFSFCVLFLCFVFPSLRQIWGARYGAHLPAKYH